MAYENFIPEVWKKKIEHDLEKLCVFAEDCNRKYEGEVKQCGDTVHILTSGKPTIKTLARENANDDIDAAEMPEGTDTVLVIDQIRYFNFKVGDIDKAQAVDGVLDELTLEADEGLADEVDQYLAKLHLNSDGKTPVEGVSVVEQTALTKDNVLDLFDDGQQILQEHNVKSSTKVVVVIPPAVNKLFKKAYIKEDTNNHEEMKNGKIAMYSGITVKLSNNVVKDSDGTYHMQMKTQRALAYANPKRHVEPYRPEKSFADAVKGFILFGAKVVRPAEIVDLQAKIAA
jgi:hypothetical protein